MLIGFAKNIDALVFKLTQMFHDSHSCIYADRPTRPRSCFRPGSAIVLPILAFARPDSNALRAAAKFPVIDVPFPARVEQHGGIE